MLSRLCSLSCGAASDMRVSATLIYPPGRESGMLWVDITNLPHVRLFAGMIRSRRCFVTARQHTFLLEMLRREGIEFCVAGRYERTLEGKLIASAERVRRLAELLMERRGEIRASVAKHSVEAPRVSFGLGIPHVQLVDNEHAEKQNRLFLSLCERIVTPEAVDVEELRRQGARRSRLVRFRGVFEHEHLRSFTPDSRVLERYGLKPQGYVLYRPPPVGSSYCPPGDPSGEYLRHLTKRYRVVVVPRGEALEHRECICVQAGDTLSLSYFARAVLSGGGTMTREAALMGTCSITLYAGRMLGVDRWLISEGVLFRATTPEEAVELIESAEVEELRERAAHLRAEMQSPLEVVERTLEGL